MYLTYLKEVLKVAWQNEHVRQSIDLSVRLQLLKVYVHLIVRRVKRVKGALLEKMRGQPETEISNERLVDTSAHDRVYLLSLSPDLGGAEISSLPR